MPNLQKVIKVTQAQYDILAGGGTVGDYTGLNANYIYLIVDENEYITNYGGTIDSGNLTIGGGYQLNVMSADGVRVYSSNDTTVASFCADYYGGKIISNNTNHYMPLFANDDFPLIYSGDSDYSSDFTFTTKYLSIRDDADTGHYLQIDTETASFYYGGVGNEYSVNLPSASGTLALTSDIPSVSLTTTAGSESITVGSNTLNVVTRDTDQTISGVKTFSNGLQVNTLKDLNGNNKIGLGTNVAIYGSNLISGSNGSYDLGTTSNTWKDLYLSGKEYLGGTNNYIYKDSNNLTVIGTGGNDVLRIGGTTSEISSNLRPNASNSKDLGAASYCWKNIYVYGYLSNGNSSYGLVLPSTTGWTANKTIATTEDLPQVMRFI